MFENITAINYKTVLDEFSIRDEIEKIIKDFKY